MVFDPYVGMHNAKLPDEVKDISPFVRHLLAMDSRIRVCHMHGDVEREKGLFLTKSNIFIPYMVPSIEHDISHLLEMEDSNRWTMPDLGMLSYNGQPVEKKSFFGSLKREIKTRAIQLHLNPKENGVKSSTVFDILRNNSVWDKMTVGRLPYLNFRSMQNVQTWAKDLREKTYHQWSLDRINHEWMVRLNHLQNWMETS